MANEENSQEFQNINKTRHLAACTPAVVILTSTSYMHIATELNVLHLNWAKFNRINVLKLFCLSSHFLEPVNSSLHIWRPLRCHESRSLHQLIGFSLFFVTLCRTLSFFAFLKKGRWAWGIHAKGGPCLMWVLSHAQKMRKKNLSVQRCLLLKLRTLGTASILLVQFWLRQ